MVDCGQIIYRKGFHEMYYIQKVLGDYTNLSLKSKYKLIEMFTGVEFPLQLSLPERYYQYTDTILRVLKYLLNEYSLLNSAHPLSPISHPSVANQQKSASLSFPTDGKFGDMVSCRMSLIFIKYIMIFPYL